VRLQAFVVAFGPGSIERRRFFLADPTSTDPDKYSVVFENDQVRVLEYRDEPGAKTQPHDHPNSVMISLSRFDRRLSIEEETREVTIDAGDIRWLDAQTHSGENIGSTETHVVFVELKGGPRHSDPRLGPS
jgi:beta-alanine degradation protein BauB